MNTRQQQNEKAMEIHTAMEEFFDVIMNRLEVRYSDEFNDEGKRELQGDPEHIELFKMYCKVEDIFLDFFCEEVIVN